MVPGRSSTVVVVDPELFDGFVSVSFEVPFVVAVSEPKTLGTTTKVTVAEAPAARSFKLATTDDPWSTTVPWVELPETKLTPLTRGLERMTPVAGDGPLLVTIAV